MKAKFVIAVMCMVLMLALAPASVAQDSTPVCTTFTFSHVDLLRRSDGVANVDFAWEPVEGATWYRLRIIHSSGEVVEYLLGDLGKIVPVSDLPTVGDFVYEVIALDGDQNVICKSAPGAFNIEVVSAGGFSGSCGDCSAACDACKAGDDEACWECTVCWIYCCVDSCPACDAAIACESACWDTCGGDTGCAYACVEDQCVSLYIECENCIFSCLEGCPIWDWAN